MGTQPEKRVSVFSLDPDLKIPADSSDIRFIVMSPQGPRHIELSAVLESLKKELPSQINKSDVEEVFNQQLSVVREQLESRVKTAANEREVEISQLPVFYVPSKPSLAEVPGKPEHLADTRDFYNLTKAGSTLAFIQELPVYKGFEDWRGQYASPKPEEPVAPTIPDEGSPVSLFKSWAVTFQQWRSRYATYLAELGFWKRKNRVKNLTSDGSKAATDAQLVILKNDVEILASMYGVSIKHSEDVNDSEVLDPTALIPALVIAIQEIQTNIASDAYTDKIAEVVYQKIRTARGNRSS